MTAPVETATRVPGRLPVLGHVVPLLRNPLRFFQSLRAYGDIVKIHLGMLPVYVVNSPELIRQMLVVQGRSFGKGRMIEKVRPLLGNGIMNSVGEFHQRQRRLMQSAFHHGRIDQYAEIMRELAFAKAESWRAEQVLAMDHEMHELALGVAAKTLFSSGLGREVVAEVQRSLPIMLNGLAWRTMSPTDLLEKLPTPGNRRFNAANARLRQVIDDVISAYRADATDRGDLLSMLLMARDQDTGEGMTDNQVRDELVTVMVAGTETSGTTLAWVFHELGQHPDIERRLHAELDEVLANRPIRDEGIAKLDYTRRVISETLRLRYPIWLLMRRAATSVELGGMNFPPGVEFWFSLAALHRDPDVYSDPMRFDPDRWLPDRVKNLPWGAFIPFGAGSHKCIGDSFAWTEVTIAVATIATRWRLLPVPGHKVREMALATLRPSEVPMIAVPRHA